MAPTAPTQPSADRVVVHDLVGRHRQFPVGPALERLTRCLQEAGGRPIVVGGAVRDHVLGRPAKDVDVEVYGLDLERVEAACARAGEVHAVGRSFGVLKVRVAGAGSSGATSEVPFDETFDVALPRRESKVGAGHRGFVVVSDPEMTFADAAARRDFTMNALGYDLASGTLLDPHGGALDLAAGVLRHVSDAFDEDPLRVLRACQLAARFSLTLDEGTVARCRRLGPELPTLAKERLWEEMKKLLLLAPWPSVGLAALDETGALSLFPELAALQGCPQEPEWHPEGDVWVHTLMVVDEAARIGRDDGLDDDERLLLLLGALCHDLGKPPVTERREGRIKSPGHESAGEAPTRAFLDRLCTPHAVIDDVVALVREHLKPFQLFKERGSLGDAAVRRLATRVPLERLVRVARADHFGRTTSDAIAHDDPAGPWLLDEAARLRVKDEAPTPLLKGRHLLPLGVPPGPGLGVILQEAFEAQLEGAFSDVEGALAWVKERLHALGGSGLALLLVALVGFAGIGCDPSSALSRAGLFAFSRDALVTGCCECLAETVVSVDNPSMVCPEVDVELVGEVDGGCPAGEQCFAASLRQDTPCLCGDDLELCHDKLMAAIDIVVVGQCLDSRGPCTGACSGVLAFPE